MSNYYATELNRIEDNLGKMDVRTLLQTKQRLESTIAIPRTRPDGTPVVSDEYKTDIQAALDRINFELAHREKWSEKRTTEYDYDPMVEATIAGGNSVTLWGEPLNDLGNARRFAQLYGNIFKYNHSKGVWLHWTGVYWAEDKHYVALYSKYIDTLQRAKFSAIEQRLKDEDKILHWLVRSGDKVSIDEALYVARRLPEFSITNNDLNTNPMLLAVENGIVDLTTGELLEPKPEDLITQHIDIPYDPTAEAPRWIQFLHEIFNDNIELIHYVHKAVGYSLTGRTDEQCFFVLHGNGCNGKSTFLNVLVKVLGGYNTGYASIAEFNAFSTVPHERGSTRSDLAMLATARFVVASETGKHFVVSPTVIKAITGGDPITCRFLYQDEFTYVPKYKIWLATNYKPNIPDSSEAMWRRVKLIPFDISFEEIKDMMLPSKLERELVGILAWAIEGAKLWANDKLGDVSAVNEATQAYREEQDSIQQFVNTYCYLDKAAWTPAGELCEAYRRWAFEEGTDAPSWKSARETLMRRFGITYDRTAATRVYKGIGLLADADTV